MSYNNNDVQNMCTKGILIMIHVLFQEIKVNEEMSVSEEMKEFKVLKVNE